MSSTTPLSKRDKTRLHILGTAVKQFAKHGYDGVSMDGLAKSMKLTKGALYGHFAGKKDIYIQSLSWYMQSSLRKFFPMNPPQADAKLNLEFYLSWMLDVMEDDVVFRKLLLHVMIDSDEQTAATISSDVLIQNFRTLVHLIEQYRPKLNAVDYAYSFVSISLLSREVRTIALIPLEENDTLQKREILKRHFMEMLG